MDGDDGWLKALKRDKDQLRILYNACLLYTSIPSESTGDFAMNKMLIATLLATGLFVGILIFLEVGRRVGGQRLALDPEGARAGTGTVEGAVFALVGLLIAFTFSGAASRFDARRDLIVQETNAIGTAWLRLDLLPASAQPAIRENFRRYVDSLSLIHI